MHKFVPAVAALVMLAGIATGAVEATSAAAGVKGVEITSRSIPGLGQVLVDSEGRTLYMFVPDKQKKVTCFEECAEIWPPVFLNPGQKSVAAGKVKQKLLGNDPDPSTGLRVVTYNGWPLYTYITDTAPGKALGQAVNLTGGLWYVISTSGKVIKTKP